MGDCCWVNHDQQYETDCGGGGSFCGQCVDFMPLLDTLSEGTVIYHDGSPYTGAWPTSLDTVYWGPVTIPASELAGVVSMDGSKAMVRSFVTPFCVEDIAYYAVFDVDDPQNTLTCVGGFYGIPPEFICC